MSRYDYWNEPCEWMKYEQLAYNCTDTPEQYSRALRFLADYIIDDPFEPRVMW